MLLLSAPAFAGSYEYQVVYLESYIDVDPNPKNPLSFKPKTVEGALDVRDGYILDVLKTSMLNRFALDGWEIIAVLGDSGGGHAVYLKRLNE